MTSDTTRFESAAFISAGQRDYRLPVLDRLMERPFDIPYRLSHVKSQYIKENDSFFGLLMNADGFINARVRRGKYWNPLWRTDDDIKANKPDLLFSRIEKVFNEIPTTAPIALDRDSLRPKCSQVEKRMQNQLALLIDASLSAYRFHHLAFQDARRWLTNNIEAEMAGQFRNQTLEERATKGRDLTSPSPEELKAVAAVDMNYLCAGALELALAVDRTITEFEDNPPTAPLDLSVNTPLGWIEVHTTTGTRTYTAERHYWLILDFAGDTIYHSGGGARCLDQPIGVLMDFGGNDVYESPVGEGGHFGGGLYGYGYLYDQSGDDTYAGHFITQGAGYWGVGVLMDRAGNDRYLSAGYAQGAAQYGLGILSDGAGNDQYQAVCRAQGYGGTLGHGLLLEMSGDDVYTLQDPGHWFPSAQNPMKGTSLGQGAGAGERDDLGTGHSMGGGFGLLIDAAGKDKYKAELFAQGVGYWYGAGALLDDAGDDEYDGVYYNQGSGAHFGVGVLIDLQGNDHYRVSESVGLGAGHDFTVGLLVDAGGDDVFEAPSLSLGAANDNGIGIFLKLGGNGVYRFAVPNAYSSFGSYGTMKTGTMREDLLGLGLFLAVGGKSTYPEKSGFLAGCNRLVVQPPRYPQYNLKSERGVFLDSELSTCSLRLAPLTPDTEPKSRKK
ncbi:MAG: hypothetical protein NTX50_17025 [Candidatus Sumerlaeota bacterium]|nr:hypothetical protein [Candidatus Sumerlaeota bacterium]